MKSHPLQPCLCQWFTPGLKKVPDTGKLPIYLLLAYSPLPPLGLQTKPSFLNQPSYLNRPSFLNQPSYEPTFKNYYPFGQQKMKLVVDNNTCRCGHPRCCHRYVGVNFNKNIGFK